MEIAQYFRLFMSANAPQLQHQRPAGADDRRTNRGVNRSIPDVRFSERVYRRLFKSWGFRSQGFGCFSQGIGRPFPSRLHFRGNRVRQGQSRNSAEPTTSITPLETLRVTHVPMRRSEGGMEAVAMSYRKGPPAHVRMFVNPPLR